jgi:hypothetical protein
VRESFRALAEQRPECYLVLDAGLPVEELAAAIRDRVRWLVADLPTPGAAADTGATTGAAMRGDG